MHWYACARAEKSFDPTRRNAVDGVSFPPFSVVFPFFNARRERKRPACRTSTVRRRVSCVCAPSSYYEKSECTRRVRANVGTAQAHARTPDRILLLFALSWNFNSRQHAHCLCCCCCCCCCCGIYINTRTRILCVGIVAPCQITVFIIIVVIGNSISSECNVYIIIVHADLTIAYVTFACT